MLHLAQLCMLLHKSFAMRWNNYPGKASGPKCYFCCAMHICHRWHAKHWLEKKLVHASRSAVLPLLPPHSGPKRMLTDILVKQSCHCAFMTCASNCLYQIK